MKNHIIVGLALGAVAFTGCSKQPVSELKTSSTEGAAKFNVEIPDTDDSISSATLTLTCPGFTQTHTLDISARLITASFGGIAPGECTAALAGTTEAGYPCAGDSPVVIAATEVTEQTLTLTCRSSTEDNGGAILDVELVNDQCPAKVKKIYAVPGGVPVPESTSAQLELLDGQSIASASLTVASNSVGSATVSALSDCADGASNCWSVTCDVAGRVYLDLATDDGAGCDDTEQLIVVCEGEVFCGNGVLDTDQGEVCDGELGVTAPDVCAPNCSAIILACGNGVLDAGESCDSGSANGTTSSACRADCTPTVCGDNVQEGLEACDDGNLVDGDGCESDCTVTPSGSGNACLDCMTNESGVYYTVLGTGLNACLGDANCETMLTCFTESKCANGAGSVAECVCGFGADIDACNQGTAAATGVCVDELRAIVGDLSNADLLLSVTSQQNASGRAYALYNPAATNGQAQCNGADQCGGAPVTP